MDFVKRVVVNTLATTALTLVTLAGIAFIMGGSALFLGTVFQSLAANILIHAGLPLVRMVESRYMLLELLFEIGYVLLVLIGFGFVFSWYASTPLWIVILMGVGIYYAGSVINIIRVNKDVMDINVALGQLHHTEK